MRSSIGAMLVVCVISAPLWSAPRVWRDSTGKLSVEAELVKSDGTHVELRKADGKIAKISIARLSTADQNYLRSLAKAPADGDDSTEKPQPQPKVDIPPPPTPPEEILGISQADYPLWFIASTARQFYADGLYDAAAAFQYWTAQRLGRGYYDLACNYALAGNVDAAIYWLQHAAQVEGVDASWAAKDKDMKLVWEDERWPKVAEFLLAMDHYWSTSGIKHTSLIVPTDYKPGTPIPLLVGLHGFNSNPEDYVDDEYQELADELDVAILGISATLPSGPVRFRWDDVDVERNIKHIEAAIAGLADKVTPAPGRSIAFGFSQGACVAAELAARRPEQFAGALIFSPGSNADDYLVNVASNPAHKKQGFVLRVGAGEAPGNILITRTLKTKLQELGGETDFEAIQGQDDHSHPEDFSESLPEWIEFVSQHRAK